MSRRNDATAAGPSGQNPGQMLSGSLDHARKFLARPARVALALLLAGSCNAAGPAAAEDAVIVIDRAVSVAGDTELFPVGETATAVALPDHWTRSHPGYSGSVWYRSGFVLAAAASRDQLHALYVRRACSNLQVRLNGFLVYSGGRMAEPVTRNCDRPQFVSLPNALLRSGENTLDLRLRGFALERVGSVEAAAGLSAIEFGNQSTLRRSHAAHYFWTVTWTDATGLVLIGIGCVLLAVGWLNRREVYFAYLGWLSLGWAAVSLATLSRDMPWPNEVTEFMLASAWPVLLAMAVQFFLSFAGLRSRTIETLVALQWVLLPATLVLVGPEFLFVAARIWYVLLALEIVAVMTIYLSATRRQRPQDLLLMGLVTGFGTLVLLTALAVQWQLVEPHSLWFAHLFLPVAFAAVGARLLIMFARALRATEDDRNRVVGQLHRLNAEMQTRVEHLTAQRVGQFTELERKRIASDLHDDLGAKLLTIVHTADTSRLPQLAREALEEMRLSVRGLAGKAVRLEDAIADWRAETISRLEQAGIQGGWAAEPAPDSPVLTARTYMQLTRILRESISNVIKHSGARHCDITCVAVESTLRMLVKDDGRGIDRELDRGQGVSSMKRRAKRLSGQCLVESRPGHGVVISLTVPV